MKEWILITENYNGLYKKAVDTLSGVVSGYLQGVLPIKLLDEIDDTVFNDFNIILLGNS